MAFRVWIDDANITSTNLLTESDFTSNMDRRTGFKSGSAASAKNVNSAIRQANLIAVALMQSMGITNLNLTSSLADVKSAIDSYFTNAFNAKLGTNGDGKDVKVTFTAGTTQRLNSGDKLSTLFGILSAWCESFGSLAKKSIVENQDIKNSVITAEKIVDGQVTTEKFSPSAKAPFAGTADTARTTSFTNSEFLNGGTGGSELHDNYIVLPRNVGKPTTYELRLQYRFTNTLGHQTDCYTSLILTVDKDDSIIYSSPLGMFSLMDVNSYDKYSDINYIYNLLLRTSFSSTSTTLRFVMRKLDGTIDDVVERYFTFINYKYRILQ